MLIVHLTMQLISLFYSCSWNVTSGMEWIYLSLTDVIRLLWKSNLFYCFTKLSLVLLWARKLNFLQLYLMTRVIIQWFFDTDVSHLKSYLRQMRVTLKRCKFLMNNSVKIKHNWLKLWCSDRFLKHRLCKACASHRNLKLVACISQSDR